jgi:hypothetical protein
VLEDVVAVEVVHAFVVRARASGQSRVNQSGLMLGPDRDRVNRGARAEDRVANGMETIGCQ